jgi:hypothetical protein
MDAWHNNQPIIVKNTAGVGQQSLRVFNNTIVLGDNSTARFLMIGNLDTLIAKNNIVVADSGIQFVYGLYDDASNYSNITYKDIDYNQLWAKGGIGTKMYGGGAFYYTFGAWKTYLQSIGAVGYDANSDTSSVSFVNKWGTNAIDYKLVNGSTGVNTGADLSNIIPATDILGRNRPQGGWHKGALEP